MKKVVIFCIALFCLPIVHGLGLSPDSILIEFEPHFEREYTFITEKSDNNRINIEGPLLDYFEIIEDNMAEDGTFKVKVSLPEWVETPGDNVMFVSVAERGKSGGMVGAMAAIKTPVVVRVPYPGQYADISLRVADVNHNETAVFSLVIANRGTEEMVAEALFRLETANKKPVKTYEKNTIVIDPGKEGSMALLFNASEFNPGNYNMFADATWGDQSQTLQRKFRIGELAIDIIKYPRFFYEQSINKMEITIESRWGAEVRNVYGEVTITNESGISETFRTTPVHLQPFSQGVLEGFWDTKKYALGNYSMYIQLFFDGGTAAAQSLIQLVPVDVEQLKWYQQAQVTTILLASIVVLLVLLNIIILLRRRKQ